MILLADYLMGRDKQYPVNEQQLRNACDLLVRVNSFLLRIGYFGKTCTSGYRPGHFNKKAGGAARSGHLVCSAIDIEDTDLKLAAEVLRNMDLLEEYGLYLENVSYTKGWVHLQSYAPASGNRVFIPY
jgi:uncharacterized protein YcbK (DUF882 family)